MSIDKNIFNKFFIENKKYLDYKPTEYSINEENFIKWINNYEKDSKYYSLASLFRKYSRYVSYNEFISKISSVCASIRAKASYYKNIILVIENKLSKSNFWIALLNYHFLNDIITEIYTGQLKYYIPNKKESKDESKEENTLAIICDDASYTGSQLKILLGDVPNNMDVIISVPFISSIAYKKLKNTGCIFSTSTDIFYTFEENLKKDLFTDQTKVISFCKKNSININKFTIYFDHKLADMYSIYQDIYAFGTPIPGTEKYFNYSPITLIKNCNFEDLYQEWTKSSKYDIQNITQINKMCPSPFYKNFEYKYRGKSITDLLSLNKTKYSSNISIINNKD